MVKQSSKTIWGSSLETAVSGMSVCWEWNEYFLQKSSDAGEKKKKKLRRGDLTGKQLVL